MDIIKINNVSDLFAASEIFINENKFYSLKNKCIEESLRNLSIEYETEGENILIKVKSYLGCNCIPFDQLKYFDDEYLDDEFIIWSSSGEFFSFQNPEDISFQGRESFKNRCYNLLAYYKLLRMLKLPEIADHYNGAKNEIVMYSSLNGISKIKFDNIPDVPDNNDYYKSVEELIKNLSSIELRQFYKNAFFADSNSGIINLLKLIVNCEDIIYLANKNYELVSKQFNFESFKDSLLKEKEKYFSSVREIVNKIFSQAISIPISITATGFATYKIGNDIMVLLLILFSFILYAFFYIYVQLIYKNDLKVIREDFLNDFCIIKSKSGLENNIIDAEKIKIEKKISQSISVVDLLLTSVSMLGFLMLLYVLCQIFEIKNPLFRIILNVVLYIA